MRAFFLFLAGVVILAAVLVTSAIWYIKPSETLNLKHAEVSISGKIMEMVKKRKFQVTLTEQDLNDLLKKLLAENRQIADKTTITGAKFALHSNQVVARLNLTYDQKLAAEAKLDFVLHWKEPYIVVTHVRTMVKDVRLPSAWLKIQPIYINISEQVPSLVTVKDVSFAGQQIEIALKLR